MKYKAVLFDADGLIIHSPRFSERLQKEYGITWETLKPFFQGPFQECKVGKADLENELAKTIKAWGWKDSVDALLTFWFQGDIVDEEIKNTVSDLRQNGVRCYLATNQEEYREEYLENKLELNKIFDGFFVSARLGYLKKIRDSLMRPQKLSESKNMKFSSSITTKKILMPQNQQDYPSIPSRT